MSLLFGVCFSCIPVLIFQGKDLRTTFQWTGVASSVIEVGPHSYILVEKQLNYSFSKLKKDNPA